MANFGHSNLMVRNIPPEINEVVLRSLFETYGNVLSCRILKSWYRGSPNVGFVKFSQVEEAQLAIQYMHSAKIENNRIEVRFADQDIGERRPAYDDSSHRHPSPRKHPCKNLYVKGFPRYWTVDDLIDLFSNFGTVLSAKVLSHRESSGRSGAGLVMMSSVEEAAVALRHIDGRVPLGGETPIVLKYANSDAPSAGGKVKKEAPSYDRMAPYCIERPRKKPYVKKSLPPVLTQAAIQSSNLCPVIGQQFKLAPVAEKSIKHEPHSSRSGEVYKSETFSYDRSALSPIDRQDALPSINSPAVKTSLYIRNLPHDVDELRLYELFGQFGGIRSVKRLPDRDPTRGGVGFVNYVDYNSASRATAEMHGVRIGNNELIITLQVRPTYNR